MSLKSTLACVLCAVLTLTACGDDEKQSKSAASANLGPTVIKVGVCPGPYGSMVQNVIAPILKEQGYEITVVEFTDYVQPDLALESGSIDANLMQHQSYLEGMVQNQGLKIEAVTSVPTLGMGLFSQSVTDLDSIPRGAKAAIPNDAVNLARTLRFCRDIGLITLKDQKDEQKASLSDIGDNPYEIEFTALEAAQVPRTLDSVDLAFVPGNYAYAAKLDFDKALAVEDVAENIKNVVAVKLGDEKLHDLFFKAVRSKAFKDAIDNSPEFRSFPRPYWWNEADHD